MKARPDLFDHIQQEPNTVTESTLIKRVNRKLAHQDEYIGKHHGPYTRAPYYISSRHNNVVLCEFDDLESMAREIGVLRIAESVVY